MSEPTRHDVGRRPSIPSRRSLITGAAGGLAVAAGAGLGLGRPSPALAAETATPDWFNVTNPAYGGGADPTGTTDSTSAIQAAINAAAGGVVYFPAGTYLVGRGPLTLASGIRLTGDGMYASTLHCPPAGAGLFNAGTSARTDNVEIDHLTLQCGNGTTDTSGSDIFSGANITRWRVHDCLFIQYSSSSAIWTAPSVAYLVENCFWHNQHQFWQSSQGARTVPAWNLIAPSVYINQNTWHDEQVFNESADSAQYVWHLAVTSAGARYNQFRNISVEHPNGGIIHIESLTGTLIDNVVCWDPASFASPLFWIDQNPAAGIAPQHTTIRHSGRLSGPENGTPDILLHPSAVQTLIEMYGAESAGEPPILDLGNSSHVTLIGLPPACTLRNAAGATFADVNGATWLPQSSPQPEDLALAGWSYDPGTASGTSTKMGTSGTAAAGSLQLIKIPLRSARQISNVRLYLSAAGGGLTPSQNYVGVYTSDGTLVGTSASQAAAWNNGPPGALDAALPGGPFTAGGPGSGGFIWVAILWNGTTAPAFLRTGNLTPALANGTLSAAQSRYGAVLSGQTNLPSSFSPSSITQLACELWAAVW